MYTKPSLIALALITMLSCRAQKAEERNIEAFTKIEVRGAVEVIYRQADSLSLKVEARPAELERVQTTVRNGVLLISNKGEFDDNVKVYVTHNDLRSVDADGATVFRSDGTIKASVFDVNASGASNLKINVEAEKISGVQSGASQLTLSGKSDQFRARLSGAASLRSYELAAKDVEVESTGAANAKVLAVERFRGNAGGASSIKLKGEPADVVTEASAAASINRVKEKSSAGSDTLIYNLNKKKVIIVNIEGEEGEAPKKKKATSDADDFKHWRGVSFGVNGYLTPQGSIDMNSPYQYLDLNYARSFNYQINPIERHFYIARHNFKIVTGLGFDLRRYELANRTTLRPDSIFTWGDIDSSGSFAYKKNKFRATYLQVPLMFEFNTSNDHRKTFHVAVGVIGQYLIGSSTKQVFEQDGNDFRIKNKDDYNLNPFGLKAHVNMGYRGWTIFAEYNLTTLFKTSRGPELYPVAAGLRVIPFS